MLVGPRKEKRVVLLHGVEAADDVCHNRRVCMPQMGPGIYIVNWRCYVEGVCHGVSYRVSICRYFGNRLLSHSGNGRKILAFKRRVQFELR